MQVITVAIALFDSIQFSLTAAVLTDKVIKRAEYITFDLTTEGAVSKRIVT